MPRKSFPPNSICPFHITARSVNRVRFEPPMDDLWTLMENHLFFVAHAFEIKIHSFVLMPNHFHLLASSPQANMGTAMNFFLRETSKEMNRLTGKINQNYGTRHHKCLLGDYHYFMNAYKYVYQNPLRASLCTYAESYPYSTLAGLCGVRPLRIPVVEDTILFDPNFDESALQWINQRPSLNLEEEMRLGLRRSMFELKASFQNGKTSRLQSQLL